jgi:hypothetical protein
VTDDGKRCPSCTCGDSRRVAVMGPDGISGVPVETGLLLMFRNSGGYKAQVVRMPPSGTTRIEDLELVGPSGQYDRDGTLLAELPQMTADEMRLAGVFHPQQPAGAPFWAGLA